jgi:hypothetical protein
MAMFVPRLLLGIAILNLVLLFGELALQVFGVMFRLT